MMKRGQKMLKGEDGIRYLNEWRGRYYRAPKMLSVIELAIKENGENALSMIVIGTPSQHPDSRCYKQSKLAGWEWFTVYPAICMVTQYRPRRWKNLVVQLLPHSSDYKPSREVMQDTAEKYYARLEAERLDRDKAMRQFIGKLSGI
jgi:hypothetical protein